MLEITTKAKYNFCNFVSRFLCDACWFCIGFDARRLECYTMVTSTLTRFFTPNEAQTAPFKQKKHGAATSKQV